MGQATSTPARVEPTGAHLHPLRLAPRSGTIASSSSKVVTPGRCGRKLVLPRPAVPEGDPRAHHYVSAMIPTVPVACADGPPPIIWIADRQDPQELVSLSFDLLEVVASSRVTSTWSFAVPLAASYQSAGLTNFVPSPSTISSGN